MAVAGNVVPTVEGDDPQEIGRNGSDRLSLAYAAVIIILATVSARSVNNMVQTTIPFLAKYAFGFSNVLVGLLSAALNVSTFTVTSLVNPHLKSSTRRKIFILAMGAIPVLLFLYYLSTPAILWPLSILSGLSFGIIFPNMITSATLHREHKVQMRLLAIYSMSLSLSLVLGPSMETWLLGFLSYRQIFLPFIALALVGFAVSPFIKFPQIRREIAGIAVLRNRGLISGIFTITIYNVPFAAITSFLVIFSMDRFSVSSATAYSAFIFFFLTSFLSRFAIAVRPFRSLFVPLLLSAFITVLGLWLIPFMGSFTYFVIIMALMGIPHGTIFPLASMLIARGTTPAERNVANSYYMAYTNFLFIIVPAIIGYLSTTVGFGSSFLALSITSIIATGMMILCYTRNKSLFSRVPPDDSR